MTIFKRVQNPIAIRNSFASSIKFKICLVTGISSSSMTSFFKSTYEKLPKKGVINVYGPPGCGKTYFFSSIDHVKFDHDILRTKERTVDFMNMMRSSLVPLVLDNFELVENFPGVKELKLLKVPFYIISESVMSLDIITDKFNFPTVPVEEFSHKHNIHVEEAIEKLNKANGNMTIVKTDLESSFECIRDVFIGSKEYVKELIQSDTVSGFLDRHLSEHGNTFGMIHENYPDYSNNLCDTSHSLSNAQLIDNAIYSDVSWDLMPFFNVNACLIPSMHMSGECNDSLRPGSVWTKYSNMCMKMSRLKKLRIPREHVWLWALKANSGEVIPFESYDIDSINQLSFIKIKPKILTSLKKSLKGS